MTREEFRKIEAWLYKIKSDFVWRDKLNAILPQMREELKELGIPSVQAVNYDKTVVSGGEKSSIQERWITNERMQKRVEKFNKLLLEKIELDQKLCAFERIMNELIAEDPVYEKVYTIKYGRYYPKDRKPTDEEMAIEIGCTRMTFYRLRKRMVEKFAQVVV